MTAPALESPKPTFTELDNGRWEWVFGFSGFRTRKEAEDNFYGYLEAIEQTQFYRSGSDNMRDTIDTLRRSLAEERAAGGRLSDQLRKLADRVEEVEKRDAYTQRQLLEGRL